MLNFRFCAIISYILVMYLYGRNQASIKVPRSQIMHKNAERFIYDYSIHSYLMPML